VNDPMRITVDSSSCGPERRFLLLLVNQIELAGEPPSQIVQNHLPNTGKICLTIEQTINNMIEYRTGQMEVAYGTPGS
jgi:hypothetical protein